jgi:hypothetical protein
VKTGFVAGQVVVFLLDDRRYGLRLSAVERVVQMKAFEALEERVLPELIRARERSEKRLRIWSAGCCTGEEAYSIAIAVSRVIPDPKDWNLTILSTDVNPRFLKKEDGRSRLADVPHRQELTVDSREGEAPAPVEESLWGVMPQSTRKNPLPTSPQSGEGDGTDGQKQAESMALLARGYANQGILAEAREYAEFDGMWSVPANADGMDRERSLGVNRIVFVWFRNGQK